MERGLDKDLLKIIKKERFQGKMVVYVSGVGKILLFVLPILLLIVTILAFISVLDFTLKIVFFVILGIYAFNSIMLFLGANSTNLLFSSVKSVVNLLKIIALICFLALILFLIMLLLGDMNLGFAAAGLALIGLGLAIIIRSLNLNIHDVNGLQDFYKPTTHQIFLDNLFGEVFSDHLDPVTFLKWDEYLAGINKILTPSFIQKIKEQEVDELPITFAIESLLFLYYLKYQKVLTKEQFTRELAEIIKVDSLDFEVEKGLLIENSWYFSTADVFKIFAYIKKIQSGLLQNR